MRTALFALSVALLAVPVLAEPGPAFENIEQYIGRALVTENRAQRAGIHRMPPLSCPPFHLLDEDGELIKPTEDGKTDGLPPVSTKQTCGQCHDYDTVTHGYHFQMGRDELFDPVVGGEPRPPHRGPGLFGKWQLLYQRELAPKEFEDPTEIDLTPFDWVSSCAICHPGGGPAEYDRGWRRYDAVAGQDRGLALFGDGDYHESRWQDTGVVEADCFICHLDTYNYFYRAVQMKRLNYKWAATAAAELGYIWGAIRDGQSPEVYYRAELFGPDDKVDLKIRRPTDRQCMFCHDMSSVQKRGATWDSPLMQDVHTQQGMRCIDCHPGDIRHNFAKGHSSGLSVRDDLDGTMLSCEQCHATGELGAPTYDHPGIPRLHLDSLSCQACHITHRPFLAVQTVDTVTGEVAELPVQVDPAVFGAYRFGAYWGKVTTYRKGNVLDPFTPDEIEAAAAKVQPNPEKEPDAAAIQMLTALEQLAENDAAFHAVRVFRGKAYQLEEGRLKRLKTRLDPAKPGDIAEYPVFYACNEADGLVYPEQYQLGAFWTYRDGEVFRPLFLSDMKAAWDFLNSGEFRHYAFPAAPSGDAEAVDIPDPAQTGQDGLRRAIRAKLDAYAPGDRTRLAIYDDNNDGKPEVNAEAEMGLMAWALTRTLDRLNEPDLYYIKGVHAYHVAVEDALDPYAGALADMPPIPDGGPFFAVERYAWDAKRERWDYAETRLTTPYAATVAPANLAVLPGLASLAKRLAWTHSHGVEPASRALGANGCTDCHAKDSPFFFAAAPVDPFGPDAVPETVPMHELMGYARDDVVLGAWRESVLKPWAPWIVLVVALIILFHFALFGMHTRAGGYPEPTVSRFNFYERISHFLLMLSMAFLVVTGFLFFLGDNDPFSAVVRQAHGLVGYVAGVAIVMAFIGWFIHMLPARGDLKWLLHLGNYFGGHKPLPARKFNAGQKLFFWLAAAAVLVLALTGITMEAADGGQHALSRAQLYTLHDVAAVVMLVALMAHIYLGLIVNPHSVRSIFGGKVSLEWAREHHPDWKPAKEPPKDKGLQPLA